MDKKMTLEAAEGKRIVFMRGEKVDVGFDLHKKDYSATMWSERLAGALLDRLTHRVHIIEANGPSYRLRESKRRLKQPRSQPQKSGQTEPKQS